MKRISLPALAIALLAVASPASAQSALPAAPAAHLVVAGTGSVDRMPDQAVVAFTIQTSDADAARATSQNNAIYSVLSAKLRALGLSASALKTTGYGMSYNPRPPKPNPQYPDRYGFIVTRSVTATTPRIDQAGALVDAGVAAGVTNVGDVSFGLRDDRAAFRAAQAAAVADADAQARALAEAAHVRLGRIVEIAPQEYVPVPRPMVRMAAAVAVPTEIAPSDLTVRTTVTVTYAIAP